MIGVDIEEYTGGKNSEAWFCSVWGCTSPDRGEGNGSSPFGTIEESSNSKLVGGRVIACLGRDKTAKSDNILPLKRQ